MKRLISLLCACCLLFCGCSIGGTNQTAAPAAEQERAELIQNDYRGGIFRTEALRTNILALIAEMKQNNDIIRSSSPDSYWTEDGYQDFVLNFVSNEIINDTRWFNEEQCDWKTVVAKTLTSKNSFTKEGGENGYQAKYDNMEFNRNEKDDYTVIGVTEPFLAGNTRNSGTTTYRVLYDCDKDWCKAYATFRFDNEDVPDITTDLFEYRRESADSFLIQTPTERLYVVLNPATEGATSISKRTVKNLYYSKLSGGTRTTYVPYTPKPEYDEDGNLLDDVRNQNRAYARIGVMNDQGDLSYAYGKKDSQFLRTSLASTDPKGWVFEDKALAQGIIYENNVLVVVTFNKLSESYERFIYVKGTINESEIARISEGIVIEGLVGFNENGEPEPEPTPTPEIGEPEPTGEPTEAPAEPTPTEEPEPTPTSAPESGDNQS